MENTLENKKLNAMGTASIPKIILQFSVPAIISMLIEALYNIVDRYFVGQGVGSLGIGGITICFPITLFIMAMSMIVGVGGNTIFAIRLGEKKYQQAAIILNNSFLLLVIMAVAAFTLGQTFMTPLLKLFGASDQLLPVAKSYMRIILMGAIFQTIVPGMNHFIRSMGHPKTAMTRVMIGAGSNVILDWLFIMKFGWGIEGAAWATVTSQLIGGIAVMQFFVKKTTPIKINRRLMKLRAAYVRKIFILGLPPSVMQITNSLLNAILAWSLTHYGNKSLQNVNGMAGGDQAIAAFGIINSIVSIKLRRQEIHPRPRGAQIHHDLCDRIYRSRLDNRHDVHAHLCRALRPERRKHAGTRHLGNADFPHHAPVRPHRHGFGQLLPGYRQAVAVHVLQCLPPADSPDSVCHHHASVLRTPGSLHGAAHRRRRCVHYRRHHAAHATQKNPAYGHAG